MNVVLLYFSLERKVEQKFKDSSAAPHACPARSTTVFVYGLEAANDLTTAQSTVAQKPNQGRSSGHGVRLSVGVFFFGYFFLDKQKKVTTKKE